MNDSEINITDTPKIAETNLAPTPKKPNKWLKIGLLGVAGLVIVGGLVYAGYWYGIKSSKLRTQSSKPELKIQNLTPTRALISTPIAIFDPTTDWMTYTNKKHGYLIRHPNDWLVYNEEKWESDNEVSLCNPAASGLMENSSILSRKDLGRCVGFYVWESWPGEFIINFNEERWSNFPYILGKEKGEIIEISGITAVKYPFTEKSELPRKQATRIYINYSGKGYFIEFLQTDKEGNYDSVYDQILSTFKFLD